MQELGGGCISDMSTDEHAVQEYDHVVFSMEQISTARRWEIYTDPRNGAQCLYHAAVNDTQTKELREMLVFAFQSAGFPGIIVT